MSSHPGLQNCKVGDVIKLKPGRHCAEGVGVYFSEGRPVKRSTAEGTRNRGVTGIVCISVTDPSNWWRSKAVKARKYGKPRTWHTNSTEPLKIKVTCINGNKKMGTVLL